MATSTSRSLQPTLWRTCRVLANKTRLRMLGRLMDGSEQTVSEMAKSLGIPIPVASQYLRALNARGILQARRVNRWVYYRVGADESIRGARLLMEGLKRTFANERNPVDEIFRLATAFTHPRRQEIFRALDDRGPKMGDLRARTGISADALRRHLKKLVARGFVVVKGRVYRCVMPESDFGLALSRLARL